MPAGSLAARSGHLEPFSFLDGTHDPKLSSWVESANRPGADFQIQNLPLGVFFRRPDSLPSIGVAIGDRILDLGRGAKSVYSTVLADAIFTLPDTLPQGIYDAEIYGNTYGGGSYDLH